jgi:hypothetical protein
MAMSLAESLLKPCCTRALTRFWIKASTTPKVSLSTGAVGLQPLSCGKLIPPAGPEPDCAALEEEVVDAVPLEEDCVPVTVLLDNEASEAVSLDCVSAAELDDKAFLPDDGDSLSGVAALSLEYEISDDEISETCDSVSGELALLPESLPQAHRKNETNPQKIFFFIVYKITLNCGNGLDFLWFYIRKICVK